MAKNKKLTFKIKKRIKRLWKKIKSFFIKPTLKKRRYIPYIYHHKDGSYTYMDRESVIINDEPEFEIVYYKRKKLNLQDRWYKTDDLLELETKAGKQETLKALRSGEDSEYIIHKSSL